MNLTCEHYFCKPYCISQPIYARLLFLSALLARQRTQNGPDWIVINHIPARQKSRFSAVRLIIKPMSGAL